MGRERGDRERQSEREGKDTGERWIKRERQRGNGRDGERGREKERQRREGDMGGESGREVD